MIELLVPQEPKEVGELHSSHKTEDQPSEGQTFLIAPERPGAEIYVNYQSLSPANLQCSCAVSDTERIWETLSKYSFATRLEKLPAGWNFQISSVLAVLYFAGESVQLIYRAL